MVSIFTSGYDVRHYRYRILDPRAGSSRTAILGIIMKTLFVDLYTIKVLIIFIYNNKFSIGLYLCCLRSVMIQFHLLSPS